MLPPSSISWKWFKSSEVCLLHSFQLKADSFLKFCVWARKNATCTNESLRIHVTVAMHQLRKDKNNRYLNSLSAFSIPNPKFAIITKFTFELWNHSVPRIRASKCPKGLLICLVILYTLVMLFQLHKHDAVNSLKESFCYLSGV